MLAFKLRTKKSIQLTAFKRNDSPNAAPISKKVRVNEIEIQTAETSETLEKRGKEVCAKSDEYKEKAKDRDEWKRKYDELQIAF